MPEQWFLEWLICRALIRLLLCMVWRNRNTPPGSHTGSGYPQIIIHQLLQYPVMSGFRKKYPGTRQSAMFRKSWPGLSSGWDGTGMRLQPNTASRTFIPSAFRWLANSTIRIPFLVISPMSMMMPISLNTLID